MSKYVEFFAAPGDAAAAAVRNSGPAGRYPVVDASDIYFDADDAVLAWRELSAGRPAAYPPERYDLTMVADFVNDGSAVFALPDELVLDLIKASPLRLREIAESWHPLVVADGTHIDAETATALLSEIAQLARSAAGTTNRLYCWVAC
ncbi:hypothetical protein BJY16_005988 [Actinoplanes octamycinicus]|uniref:Uncharacterized protein n=1 Tax=Actinoplanes octamycinicus TaxID=135948 RepID=A0A7W7H2C2_9ACTN|nr:hypothetical protein [Actinoplanes octamycinicus]MBB4742529.1 hypothetical protein [Actinoplanes octamycinicus]GIE60867.1 hypothetical protein Aoc01nite_62690 [Actinoplanes octamycinicus]